MNEWIKRIRNAWMMARGRGLYYAEVALRTSSSEYECPRCEAPMLHVWVVDEQKMCSKCAELSEEEDAAVDKASDIVLGATLNARYEAWGGAGVSPLAALSIDALQREVAHRERRFVLKGGGT